MKKYVTIYIILFVVMGGIGLTHGILFGITVSELDYSYAFIPEKMRNIMLIYNIVIMLTCFVIAVVLAKQKSNVLKCKGLIAAIMFICLLLLPVGMSEHVRGIPQEHSREFWSIFSLFMRNFL